MLALAQPARGEIVYTPANQTIAPNQQFLLDLNNDGIADFTIDNQFFPMGRHLGGNFPTNGSYSVGNLVVFPDGPNAILVQGIRFASDLSPAKRVGKGAKWNFKDAAMESCQSRSGSSSHNTGPWQNVKARYLGLTFSIQGQIHYGWARLNVSQAGCQITAVLTGYAYETVPQKPIITGKTSGPAEVSSTEGPLATLGLLARGAAAVDVWRREG